MEKISKKNNSQLNHLRALLNKNYIIVKRSTCCTCCELVLPIVLSLMLLAVRSLSNITTLPQTSYILSSDANSKYVKTYYSTPNTFDPSATTPSQQLAEYTRLAKANLMKNCMIKGQPTMIALISNSPNAANIITTIQTAITTKMNLPTRIFQSVSDFEYYVSTTYYGYSNTNLQACFGIQIDRDDSNGFQYQLRFNVTYRASQNDIYQTSLQRTQAIIQFDLINLVKYQNSGFLAIQNWIDNLVLQKNSGISTATIIPTVTSMTTEASKTDNFSTSIQGSSGFFLVLPLIAIYIGLVQKLLYEKETRIREGMKMMGMSNTSFYLSWIITYLITGLIIVILVSVIVTRRVITTVPFGMFLIMYLLLVLNIIFQSIFISVFFTRAKPGIITAIIAYILQYILISLAGTDASESTLKLVSLSPLTAFNLAVNTMLSFQTSTVNIDFTNFDTMVSNYSIKLGYQFLAVEMFFWMFISIYLDQVFPNEFGQKKHPLFFIQWMFKSNKKVADHVNDIQEDQDESNIEKPDNQMQEMYNQNQVVDIQKMTKVYESGKKAVDNLSMTMYLNQIFVLLGHNGAGKTSTISILSGLLKYTGGSASIFGYDINNQMEEIRQFMGVCPQHDILFDNLTVREHLKLFATFKGSDPNTLEREIDKMIQDLGLQEKKNELASSLSGGQKRRLSVGIAFIGNSKFIILDEPTSGMDTSARRHIWEMLKNYRSDRIILLTTHFMDEADNLGDRIAIMSHGQLRCSGSSVFLKNKFGVGYNLSIAKKSQEQTDKIYNFIKAINPKAVKVSDVSSEELYQLPTDTVNCFQQLFESLDANLQQLGIESYGISITTLEEVFLKVNDSGSKQKKIQKNQKNLENNGEIELSQGNLQNKYESVNDKDEEEKRIMIDIDYDFKESYLPSFKKFITLLKVLIWKRLLYFKRDIKGLFLEIIIPLAIIAIGCALLTVQFITLQNSILLDMSFYNSQSIMYSGLSTIPRSNLANLMAFTQQTSQYYATSNTILSTDTNGQIADWDAKVFSLKTRNTQGSVFFTSISNNNYQYIVQANTISPEAASVFTNLINKAIIRQMISNPSFVLNCYNNPMPLTFSQGSAQQTTSGILASMVFSLALGFIPASIIVFIVKERETKVKHQQLVSGVSIFSYWVANYIVDYTKYVIYALVTCGIIKAYNISTISTGDNYGAIWAIHFINGFSMISFLYLFQFFFDNYSTAQVVIFVLYIICGTIFSIGLFILRLFVSTKDYAVGVTYFLRLFPCFTYGYSFINNVGIAFFSQINQTSVQSAYAWENNGIDIFYLAITGFAYFVIIFIIEFLSGSKRFNLFSLLQKKVAYIDHEKDSDVKEEEELIAQSSPANYAVMVDKLRKVYEINGKVAVDQVSFGIEVGNVFGLLGVNGAGKTTTFKMLTGDIISTSGNAFIYSHNIATDQEKVRQYIGYCPQFDALLENLSVQEHLQLYAAIKCIPEARRRELVDQSLYKLDLDRYKDVLSKDLSGGNKRKLSVAIAMLGNPPVIFLDEPSTGMDPEARRFMWSIISNISTMKKQSSIILTTHSMEEAEALCTKMGIMVNGELKCLGNIQHIKSKYGQGYELEVKIKPTPQSYFTQVLTLLQNKNYQYGNRINLDQVQSVMDTLKVPQFYSLIKLAESGSHLYLENQNFNGILLENVIDFINTQIRTKIIQDQIQAKFGAIIVLEHFSLFQRIKLLNNQKVGQLFGFFTQNTESLQIEQYSIKQTTIEQIFNQFAQGEIGFQMKNENQKNENKEIEVENIFSSQNNTQNKQNAR